MNQFEFVIALVFIVMAFRVISHRMGMRTRFNRHWDQAEDSSAASAERDRLEREVQELKERIKVLERITVEKENSLAKEIESLRDH